MWRITINLPFKKKKLAIIELVRELVISKMHNKFGRDTWKTPKLSRPQVNVNADAKADDAKLNCNSPPFLIKIKRRGNKNDLE